MLCCYATQITINIINLTIYAACVIIAVITVKSSLYQVITCPLAILMSMRCSITISDRIFSISIRDLCNSKLPIETDLQAQTFYPCAGTRHWISNRSFLVVVLIPKKVRPRFAANLYWNIDIILI